MLGVRVFFFFLLHLLHALSLSYQLSFHMLYEAGKAGGVEVTQLVVYLSVTFTAIHPPTLTHTQLCEAGPLVYIGEKWQQTPSV